MADFTINGVDYKSRPLDCAKQVHLMRRLLPTFTALASAMSEVRAGAGGEAPNPEKEKPLTNEADEAAALAKMQVERDAQMERLARALMPASRELAALSDADVDYVLNACLDVTERRNDVGAGWSKVRGGDMVMHRADDAFAVKLQIAWNVIGETFSDMFQGFGIDLSGLMKRVGP